MKTQNALKLILVSAIASGCATVSQCDPAVRQNTFTTAGCIFSGNYGTREETLKVTLEEEQTLAESQRQIYSLLEIEQGGVSSSLANKKAQYRQLNATLNKLISQISARNQGNTSLQQKIAGLKEKMSQVDNTPSGTQKSLALDSLNTEVDKLKKQLGY